MITVITDNTIKGSVVEYAAIGKAFAEEAKANDAGCLGMQVYTDPARPDHVIFISSWQDEASWKGHVGGASFQKYMPSMGPYYAGGTDTILQSV